MKPRFSAMLHDWPAVAREITIIVVGVLIALIAQQLVDSAHWRSEVAAFRESVDRELSADLAAYRYRIDQHACVARRIDELQRWRDGVRAGQSISLARDVGRPALLTLRTSAWSARSSDLMGQIPLETRLAYSSLYDELQNNDRQIAEEREAWRSLAAFNGAERLSSDNLMRLNELIFRVQSIDRVLESNAAEVDRLAEPLGLRPDLGSRVVARPDPEFCRPLLSGSGDYATPPPTDSPPRRGRPTPAG